MLCQPDQQVVVVVVGAFRELDLRPICWLLPLVACFHGCCYLSDYSEFDLRMNDAMQDCDSLNLLTFEGIFGNLLLV